MKRLVFVVLLTAAPVFAASAPVCDKFVKAFTKAGKAAGQEVDAETEAFWKKACLKEKEKDAAIEKQTRCLDAAKSGQDVGACLK